MTSTTFVDQSTVIYASWLNDVNSVAYSILGNGTVIPATAAAAVQNLGQIPNVGRVVMVPTAAGVWQVFGPQGQTIDISASTTGGLQEAITASCKANGTVGYDLEVHGWQLSTGGPGPVITCSTPITFPAMENKNITFGAVTINFTSGVGSTAAITFNSMVSVDINMKAVNITSSGTGPVIKYSPTSATPLTVATTISACRSFIHSIKSLTSSILVSYAPTSGTIANNSFVYNVLDGGSAAVQGVSIIASTHAFANNDLTCLNIKNLSGIALVVGTSGNTNVTWNTIKAGISTGTSATSAVNVWGQGNNFVLSIDSSGGAGATGIVLNADAAKNIFRVPQNAATTQVTDNSTTIDNEGVYGNSKPRALIAKTASQTVSSGVATTLTLDTPVLSSGGAWSNSNNRFIPGRKGWLQISAYTEWNVCVDQTVLYIAIYQNGVSLQRTQIAASGTGIQGVFINTLALSASATDYFQVVVYQASGSTQTTVAATSYGSFTLIDG